MANWDEMIDDLEEANRRMYELVTAQEANEIREDVSNVRAALRSAIAEMEQSLKDEQATNANFSDCLTRARKLWQAAHPEADYWPDGVKNIMWLLERLQAVEQERDEALEDAENLATYMTIGTEEGKRQALKEHRARLAKGSQL